MKKIFILFLILLLSSLVWAQRRDRSGSSCDPNDCKCDSLRERSGKFRDSRRWESDRGVNHHRCRHDSLYNQSELDNKLKEADFGEFLPLENPEIDQGEHAPGEDTIKNSNPGSSIKDLKIDSSDLAFGAFTEFSNEIEENAEGRHVPKNLPWIITALGLTVLAGIFMHFKKTRKFRNVFLFTSLVVLGFYLGGCPCPISGIQNVMLAGFGENKSWYSMIWFLGLLPITYVFGRVWCGWICHLGGLQEIIFRPGKFNFLKSDKTSRILKWIRIILLITLVAQVLITKTNLYKEIDPFKAAFNLYPANTITWILLILLLASSLFIYRPFCRTICPVGLVLGWVSKIPGASILAAKEDCGSCKLYERNCKSKAISKAGGWVKIDNEDCIRCGDCLENCIKGKLDFKRKSVSTLPMHG